MELNDGFEVVRKHSWVWLLPAVLSVASLLFGLLLGVAPEVPEGLHIKFTVPTGMPSLDSILQMNQIELGSNLTLPALPLALISLAVGAFLGGGWLSGVFAALRGEELTQDEFLSLARTFFARLLGVRLITFVVMVFGVVMLGMLLGPLALILLIVAMVYTFFWELAIVREDLPLGEGFSRGYQLLLGNLGEVFGVALPIALITAVVSAVASLLAQSFLGYMFLILAWSFIGGGLSVAICALYDRLVQGQQPPAQML